ncbi:MAG: hypothetical protein OXC54_10480 [Rhodospirillaceae bacterium]|nr:hypothetical protein [Rhodospirillaceae bacterium]
MPGIPEAASLLMERILSSVRLHLMTRNGVPKIAGEAFQGDRHV